MSSTTAAPSARSSSSPAGSGTAARSWLQRLDSPVTSYYVLLSVTVVMVVIGLIMVLSASSVKSLVQTDNGTPYVFFRKQLQFALLGGIAMAVAARVPLRTWKALAVPVLGGALLLQMLVFTPLGVSVNGNTNWLALGPVTIQPSELTKIGLVLVGATVLGRKRRNLGQVKHVVVPFLVPISLVTV